ncbi:uncharacterized protein CDAR_311391 [Caerostris darwini]|uniref:Uncharacterized protein n=1 Tax=Caerostris darwini TaxID=1538125 RepID=A0AAV4USP4_9ARAC|nr:uncharacterized protein CDAR_311391 [Caerostris darwini]
MIRGEPFQDFSLTPLALIFLSKHFPFQFQLVVFENYSEPADLLRNELSMLNDEDCDPVYMAPIDDTTRSSSWGANEEEDMYCVPYEDSDVAPPLPSPCLGPVNEPERFKRESPTFHLPPLNPPKLRYTGLPLENTLLW